MIYILRHLVPLAAVVGEGAVAALVAVPLPDSAADAGDLSAALAALRGHAAAGAELRLPRLLGLEPLLAGHPEVPGGDLALEAEALAAARRPLLREAVHPRQLERQAPLHVGDPRRAAAGAEGLRGCVRM